MKEKVAMNVTCSQFDRGPQENLRIDGETTSQRWKRLYRQPGGPLMGWLQDEAVKQGMDFAGLARELKVSTGYLAQLRSGIREHVSYEFAAAAAVFLGVPTVVKAQPVQLACGKQVGAEELRLLPLMVEALHAAASIHATRARVS